jgi:hypothetical protein
MSSLRWGEADFRHCEEERSDDEAIFDMTRGLLRAKEHRPRNDGT